jgi:hypothetical protein
VRLIVVVAFAPANGVSKELLQCSYK